jgi:DinB family protein
MDAKDLFLAQHAAVQSQAVGGNPMSSAERTFGGVTDEQMRMRPRDDLNSLAWLMWHIARTEDVMVNVVLAGREQVLDDAWRKRLNVSRPDFGTGMTSAEVTELTRAVDIGALREYRDAVGRRTREIVGAFKDADWGGQTQAADVQKTAAQGGFGARAELLTKAFTGRPRAAVLTGIALLHPAGHMGEASTVRTAGGFGTGI